VQPRATDARRVTSFAAALATCCALFVIGCGDVSTLANEGTGGEADGGAGTSGAGGSGAIGGAGTTGSGGTSQTGGSMGGMSGAGQAGSGGSTGTGNSAGTGNISGAGTGGTTGAGGTGGATLSCGSGPVPPAGECTTNDQCLSGTCAGGWCTTCKDPNCTQEKAAAPHACVDDGWIPTSAKDCGSPSAPICEFAYRCMDCGPLPNGIAPCIYDRAGTQLCAASCGACHPVSP